MKIRFNGKSLIISFPYKRRDRKRSSQKGRKIGEALIPVLIILSLVSWYFYYQQGLTLSYNDARSHLNVARRVIDSLQPGFAQIGSVWLPLYHVLELPLIWNNFLWKSGLAGSIISMTSYIIGGVYLIKLVKALKFDWRSLLATVIVYALNPNLLFMQTTPMTEALLIFLSIAAVYHLTLWVKEENFIDLVFIAFFTFLSSLTRYDGWFMFASLFVVVGVVAYRKRGMKFAEGNIVLFTTLAGFGVFLWFLWNLVIFNNPFYFIFGPFSAKAQQDVLLAEGRLLTKGNLVYSTFMYLLASIYNVGTWVFLLTLVGIYFFIKSKKIKLDIKIAVFTLFVPFVFNVISLFVGHSVIHLPGITPYTWFNDRYGLMMLPFVAVILGYISNKKTTAFIVVICIVIIQNIYLYTSNNVITIQDGVRGASGTYLDDAGNWIAKNAGNGLILVAASSNDALLFKSGLNLSRFITEGARKYWDTSMTDPTIYANWVVMHKGDLVDQNLRNNKNFLGNYTLMYKDDFTYIYRLTPKRGLLTSTDLPK